MKSKPFNNRNPVTRGKFHGLVPSIQTFTKRAVLQRLKVLNSLPVYMRKNLAPEGFISLRILTENFRAFTPALKNKIIRHRAPESERDCLFFNAIDNFAWLIANSQSNYFTYQQLVEINGNARKPFKAVG